MSPGKTRGLGVEIYQEPQRRRNKIGEVSLPKYSGTGTCGALITTTGLIPPDLPGVIEV